MSVVFALVVALSASPPVVDLTRPHGHAHDSSVPGQSLSARLASRLEDLQAAGTEDEAELIAADVRSIWRQQAGPTAYLLLTRARTALEIGDLATAERSYFHLQQLEPEYAEGWVASARLAIIQSDWEFALEALDTAVTLDPKRFDAWTMLAQALERADAREAALKAYREALALHPYEPTALSGHQRLEQELAGRAL